MDGLRLSEIERKVLGVIQKGMPLSLSPYRDMAEKVGIGAKQFLEVLSKWRKNGRLRRVGAIVNHFKAGSGSGAMVAWRVEGERIEEVGMRLAGFAEVSHAYERRTRQDWPYNIYTMVHGATRDEVLATVSRMSESCGISEYRVLLTERELKKSAPTYVAGQEGSDVLEG